MARRTRKTQTSSNRYYEEPSPRQSGSLGSKINTTYAAIIGGVLVLGIAIGIAFSSTANLNSENVASRLFLDRNAPNPEFCAQYGASAIVTDMRIYMTMNPFSVYVSQPSMVPGCIIRSSNWSVLEDQNLVSEKEIKNCKKRMNTFGFTGSLEGSPQINCIYQNDSAGNLFDDKGPKNLTPIPERENF